MKRSVYSLVLMDDIIKAVDEHAYRLGTSRSNLINQILAEQLSCITPEMRMKDIFNSLSNLITNSFQIQENRSDSLMILRTALEYKYRPTLNYKIELARSPDDYFGTIQVHIRTQNDSLIKLFNNFFAYRIEFESEQLRIHGNLIYSYELTPGCFRRRLINSSNLSDEKIGEAISLYIKHIDKSIKLYLSAPQAFNAAAPELEYEYKKQLEHTII